MTSRDPDYQVGRWVWPGVRGGWWWVGVRKSVCGVGGGSGGGHVGVVLCVCLLWVPPAKKCDGLEKSKGEF